MFIADAHCDTLYAIAIEGTRPEDCVVTPGRLAAGGVGLQTFALFCGKHGPAGTPYADAQAMLKVAPQVGVPILTGDLPDAPPTAPPAYFPARAARCWRAPSPASTSSRTRCACG